MKLLFEPLVKEPVITICTFLLLLISLFILNSLSPDIFPQYYLYVILSIIFFYIIYYVGFDVVVFFSPYLYILSLLLLILTLILGEVTRGTIRWIPIGGLSFQPSEVVRPFLLLFFAKMLIVLRSKFKDIWFITILGLIPVILIAIQPSFGVSLITFFGFFAMFFIKVFKLKYLLIFALLFGMIMPTTWHYLKPYQKERIISFVEYDKDPKGSGYNTIQSIISVGSGGIFGRGFKKGFQTQLKYLPEKHTDFIFAGISEELGFLGSVAVLIFLFTLFFRIATVISVTNNEIFLYFGIGTISILIFESLINIGMNLGILPITGLPLPLVSAGGSSLMSTFLSLGLIVSGSKKVST